MLFFALAKAKGAAEIQTAKPDLTITPPPEPCNPDSPEIAFDVFIAGVDCSEGPKKGDKKLIHQPIRNFQAIN